jgi:hypothetical protein
MRRMRSVCIYERFWLIRSVFKAYKIYLYWLILSVLRLKTIVLHTSLGELVHSLTLTSAVNNPETKEINIPDR